MGKFKIIIKEYLGHIKGYTVMDWNADPKLHQLLERQGAKIIEEFVEDPTLPPYIYYPPNEYEAIEMTIPRGTLRIIAEFQIDFVGGLKVLCE